MLEELLIRFPPEAVESNRFKRIAKVMGNRSEKQVASRVQKYFKKLHQANLPIPGTLSSRLRNRNMKSQKHVLRIDKPSTFFPERNIPKDLLMKDENGDDQLFPSKTILDNNRRVIEILRELRRGKCSTFESYLKFKCTLCEEFIVSKKWSCNDCDIDFCSDCITGQLLSSSFVHLHHTLF